MSSNESLTFDSILQLMDSVPNVQWTAFTMSPRAWSVIRSHEAMKPANELDHPFLRQPFGFGGIEVHVLNRQRSDVLQWHSKEIMLDFIERLEAGEDLVEANFLDACERIEEEMWPSIIGI